MIYKEKSQKNRQNHLSTRINTHGGPLIFIKRMGVDIQRGGAIGETENARYVAAPAPPAIMRLRRCAKAVDIELFWKVVMLQDALEPPCEGGGHHGQVCALTAEQKVCCFKIPFVVGLVMYWRSCWYAHRRLCRND